MSKLHLPVRVMAVFHTAASTGPNRSSFPVLARMNKEQFKITVACPGHGPLVDRLKGAGIDHQTLDFRQNNARLTIALACMLKKQKIDVLHGHMGRVGPLIACAGALCHVPAVILHEHMKSDSHFWLEGKPLSKAVHEIGHFFIRRRIDAVIAVSEGARQAYIDRQKIDPAKVRVISNGVDCSACLPASQEQRADLRARLGFAPDALLIGAAGRLIEEKGYSDFIRAAADVLKKFPRARFVLAGEGNYRRELESLAVSLGLKEAVRFTGLIDTIDPLIAGLDILVQPSRSECRESFGNVIIEAMAQRVPVIASATESFIALIDDGINGLLFREKDPGDLAEKIAQILGDPELSRRLGEQGCALCRRRFDASLSAAAVEALYLRVLASKGYWL